MGRLIYSAITSLDGYVSDETGDFEWAAPDAEVHAAVNDLLRPVGTHLYGRRMYDVLAAWETMGYGPDEPDVIRDFADLWRGADKVVYSSTLEAPRSSRTRIERRFDPVKVGELKASLGHDISIGGPTLAANAFQVGLVDDCHLFLNPIIVGAGTPALPAGVRQQLTLVSDRRFGNGVVHLHYRTTARPTR